MFIENKKESIVKKLQGCRWINEWI